MNDERRPQAPFEPAAKLTTSSVAHDADPAPLADTIQPMPELSPDQLDALKADIMKNGIRVPVVKDQHGRVIDGHNRAAIADELGIHVPVEIITIADDEAAYETALTLNCARRHLTREQIRALIGTEIQRRPGDSDRAIARRIGCDHKTVGSVRGGEIPHLSRLDSDDDEAWIPTEAEIGAHFADVIEEAFADDPETWQAAHDVAPLIRVIWPWPTHPQHVALRTIAYEIFTRCPPSSPVWDVMNPWLYSVAAPALREYDNLAAAHPEFDWPGHALAELCRVVCNPDLSVQTQLMLHKQLEVKLAFAVLDCECWLLPEQIERCRGTAAMERSSFAGGVR